MAEPKQTKDVRVAAFDPGQNIGYALMDGAGNLLAHCVTDLGGLATLDLPADSVVVMGAGTASGKLKAVLEARGFEVHEVDEYATSLKGRELWRKNVPVRGLRRLLPPGLRSPGHPIDDYAAWAIGRIFLGIDMDGEPR